MLDSIPSTSVTSYHSLSIDIEQNVSLHRPRISSVLPYSDAVQIVFPNRNDVYPLRETRETATRITDIDMSIRSSGWTGPGAGTAPQNKQDNEAFKRIKERVKAEEKERREIENARRASIGQKPCKSPSMRKNQSISSVRERDADLLFLLPVKDSWWKKAKAGLRKSMKM